MTRTALILPCVALVLVACSREPAPLAAEDEATPVPMATATGTASATPGPEESASPTTGGSTASVIPAAIRGRWGLVPADCTSTRGDAKGLLTIDATTLKFYESRATLGAVAERSDTRVRATFAFSGEGMTWNRGEALDVQDGGRTLVRREYGEDAAPGPSKYSRCPG